MRDYCVSIIGSGSIFTGEQQVWLILGLTIFVLVFIAVIYATWVEKEKSAAEQEFERDKWEREHPELLAPEEREYVVVLNDGPRQIFTAVECLWDKDDPWLDFEDVHGRTVKAFRADDVKMVL